VNKEDTLARVTGTGSAFDGALVTVHTEPDSNGRVRVTLYGWEDNDGGAMEIAQSCLVRI
jgi:hypothetical protein